MSFRAEYPGRCADCETVISPGEQVEYDLDDNLVHTACYRPHPGRPICTHCFQEIAFNGACGCGLLA